ncbi:MAG TPA: VIT and VWA domain-containing protein, partial [Leptospiraceae bacterium]|nr:VIT and VWA domain-containing protein [Leptospiraceae bacterium]
MTTSTSPKNSPTLLVTLPNQTEMIPLPISKFSIDVSILGSFARTKIGIQFYNETDRVLEGQFVFPLPQGQTISGYALEIDGKFRDAVVVEKAKGRQVFESTIRQKIDPGLLELTRGNVFQSRIYPIPAKGYKSIEVSFEQELSLKENGWAYLLPLQFEEAIEDFSIHIDIPNQEIKPILYQNEFADFNFQKKGDSYCLDYQAKRILVNQQIGFLVPQERNQKILIQKKDKDKNYFYMNLIPEAKSRPKKLPTNVCLLWDASDSGKKRDLNKEITLLQEYFQKIQSFTLEIVQFSFWIHSSKTFTIQNGNTEGVIQYLKEIQYDGGTQLGALDLSKYKCDEFLLVSDGISNFGSSELKLSDTPLYALNSSSIAEHSYLEYISRNSGGAYLNLTQLAYVDSIQILTNQ